jgi:hypothetical protein
VVKSAILTEARCLVSLPGGRGTRQRRYEEELAEPPEDAEDDDGVEDAKEEEARVMSMNTPSPSRCLTHEAPASPLPPSLVPAAAAAAAWNASAVADVVVVVETYDEMVQGPSALVTASASRHNPARYIRRRLSASCNVSASAA